MGETENNEHEVVEIRRYSNRRFYDTSRSKHITQEEIREIVRGGRGVRITDASSGQDITSRTLTQIILDYDDQKIAVLPSAMLHRLIRSSETMMLDFINQYFENATQLFSESREKTEEQWARIASMAPGTEDAARWWQNAFGGAGFPGASELQKPAPAPEKRSAEADLQQVVEELRNQLQGVQDELKTLRKESGSSTKAKKDKSA